MFQVNQSPSASFNLSFGFEFDAAGLSEVDKMEQLHLCHNPALQSPVTVPPKDAAEGNITPKMTLQAFTPHINSSKMNGSALNKFGRARERISTPIEDSEHVALFLPTHSPVFSPVTGAFQKFENSNDRSQALRRSLVNQAAHDSKR